MARRLHIYQSPSFSGAEAYALEVANSHSISHDVVFLAKPNSPLAQKISDQIKIAATSRPLSLETDPSKIDFSQFDLIVLHSTQELKKLWFRILLAKLKNRWLQSSAKKVGLPHVALYSHIWISHSKKDPLHAIPYAVVDSVLCSSLPSKTALEKFLPVPARKIKVIRYGRDTTKFIDQLDSRAKARQKLDIPENVTVIGTVARVDEGKGSQELVDAMTALLKKSLEDGSKDLYFLMIGPPTDGDPKAAALDKSLAREIEKLPHEVQSRIKKMGRVEGASHLLKAFDLFVLATYKENFALIVLEALCAEVPCVATDSGGTPDVVVPEKTGWLFEPRSSSSLLETLTKALAAKETWPRLGQNGRTKVVNEYDFKVAMTEFETAVAN